MTDLLLLSLPFFSVFRETLFGFYSFQQFKQWIYQAPHPLPLDRLIESMYKIDCKISSDYLPMIAMKDQYEGPIDISVIQPPITLRDLGWPPLKSNARNHCEIYPQLALKRLPLKAKALKIRHLIDLKRGLLLKKLEELKDDEDKENLMHDANYGMINYIGISERRR